MSSNNQSLAMQRIAKLVDENSFMEIGSLVTARSTDFNSIIYISFFKCHNARKKLRGAGICHAVSHVFTIYKRLVIRII